MNFFTHISLHHYLYLSLLLFFIGFFGVLYRRNILNILMSIELMLNAINLIFVASSQYYQIIEGQIVTFFIMTIAAAEAGVGLALAVQCYKRFKNVQIDLLNQLKG